MAVCRHAPRAPRSNSAVGPVVIATVVAPAGSTGHVSEQHPCADLWSPTPNRGYFPRREQRVNVGIQVQVPLPCELQESKRRDRFAKGPGWNTVPSVTGRLPRAGGDTQAWAPVRTSRR